MVLGTITVNVKYEKENKRLSLIVVKDDGTVVCLRMS